MSLCDAFVMLNLKATYLLTYRGWDDQERNDKGAKRA